MKSENERKFDIVKEKLNEISEMMSDIRLLSSVRIHKCGNEENPATLECVNKLVSDLRSKLPSDKEMLDWLDKNMRGYGTGWICRDSSTGRGLRLHECSSDDTRPTVRGAITNAMDKGL